MADISNWSFEQKVAYAKEQGLSDDEIRATFPPATRAQDRAQLEQTLSDLRVAPRVPRFSEREREDLKNLAALLRGDTPSQADDMAIRSGRLPGPIMAAGEQYTQDFANTQVSDLVDPEAPEEGLARIAETVGSREAKVKGGVKELARQASTPEEQMLAYAEAAHMEQRGIQEQWRHRYEILEAGKAELFDQTRPEYGKAVNDAAARMINMDLFPLTAKTGEGYTHTPFLAGATQNMGEVLAEFTPRILVDFAQKTEAMIAAGLLPDDVWSRAFGYVLAHGSTNQQAMEKLATLPPEEQVEAMKMFTRVYMESLPEELRSNFNGWMMMEDLFDDEYVEEGVTNSRFKRWMLNFVGWLGPVEMIPLASLGTGAVKSGLRVLAKTAPSARILQMQNPVRYAAAMRRALLEMPDSAVHRTFNINKVDIVETQMPHPGHAGDGIPNIPSNIADPMESARLAGASEAALDTARRLGATSFDIPEQARIVDNIANELQAAHAGRIRPNMSSVAVRDDLTGVDMQVMMGANEVTGFKSLDEAIAFAQTDLATKELEYFKVSANGTLKKVKPTLTKDPTTGLMVSKTKGTGEYYVRVKYEHTYMPGDAHLFNNNPPVVGTWMGRMMGFINTPSSFLDPASVSRFTRSYLGEQALTNQLDSIIAPLYKTLDNQQRLAVNDAMLWAEGFGKEHARMPTLGELREQFPRLSSQELRGFYAARYFQDTLWSIQNARLHNNWMGRGFRTASKPGDNRAYHGQPRTLEDVKRDGISKFLDPETGTTRTMTGDELDEFFARGGTAMKLDTAVSGSAGHAHKHILLDPEQGWAHAKLRRHVLEYIPGYNTRIYKDAHFIQRVNKRASVDGKLEDHISTVRTASTRHEAEAFRGRLVDAVGRRLMKNNWDKSWDMLRKERELANRGFELRISQDARLSDADRVQVDLSKMQTEGRLFFDDRLNKPLKNVDRSEAEIVDPINSMQRVARMTSRQVATEDLIATQKTRFFDQYKALGINTRRTSSEIDADLSDILNQGGKAEAAMAANARAEWRYIRFMEGSMVQGNTAFRRAAIASSEWLDHAVGAKIGGRKVTRAISGRAHELSPVNLAKQLSFLHFITARPVRQLLLQGSQHFALQALDPSYVGKWQMDTFSLLSALKKLARTREGDVMFNIKQSDMGKMMGRSDDEMRVLLEEFQASGLVDGVDVHSYAGGTPKSSITTPRNRVAQSARAAVATVQKPFHMARSMGFDLGEQFNVTASYLMALRRHMSERGLKKFTDLDADDWQKVANRGSHFALAMHKGNPAAWQYGFLSLPMQFLQFTHKWTLMALNSVGMRKTGLGNLQFTTAESQRIMIAQGLFWGGAGLGLKEPLRDILNSREELNWMSLEQKELLLSGLVDWGLNQVFRTLAEDPELNFAFDEVFAPSMGLDMIAEKVIEAASEPAMIHELVMGPSGQVYSRIEDAVRFGASLTGKEFEHWDFTQKAGAVLEAAAAGLLSGYSDNLKVRLAARMGQWTNAAGVGLGFEAKWEELVMKGALGVNPQRLLDYYRITGKAYDLQADLREDAKKHAEITSRIALQWGRGELDKEQALAMFNKINVIYHEYKDAGLEELFYDEFIAEFKKLRSPDGDSLLKWVTAKLLRGYTGDPVKDMLNSRAISVSEAERLEEWFAKAIQKQEENYEKRTELFERETELVRRLTDGNRP